MTPFSLLRITFDTDQQVIRSNVNGDSKCQLHLVWINFDPLAKRIKSDTVNHIRFATYN